VYYNAASTVKCMRCRRLWSMILWCEVSVCNASAPCKNGLRSCLGCKEHCIGWVSKSRHSEGEGRRLDVPIIRFALASCSPVVCTGSTSGVQAKQVRAALHRLIFHTCPAD